MGKSAKQTRTEEIKEALEKLKGPEVDGDRVLLLAQEVTAVTGQNRVQHKSSIFFNKGSTCSMITKDPVGRFGLESLKRTIAHAHRGNRHIICGSRTLKGRRNSSPSKSLCSGFHHRNDKGHCPGRDKGKI